MSEDKSKDSHQIKNGLMITLLFTGLVMVWTLLFLFVIPAFQKKFFLKATLEFIEFQSDYSFFTIFGYFCFALLAVTIVAVIFTPSFKNTKGVGIFISVLLLFSLLGAAESLFGYSYLTKEGAVFRYFISTGEKRFTWNDLEKIEISFYNTTPQPRGTKSDRMIKEIIVFKGSHKMVIRELVSGNLPILTEIFKQIKNKPLIVIDDDEKAEWEDILESRMKLY